MHGAVTIKKFDLTSLILLVSAEFQVELHFNLAKS